ncbi:MULTISPECIES: lipocalin family protein [Amniculibacterium]|uniref:lipocalin family protein n=1 Tax=Amniculibacterium TaxID=2715289 RepID=UPI000F5B2F07|nr:MULTISPECIES: lipocalin family protein [Amniculibacterium]
MKKLFFLGLMGVALVTTSCEATKKAENAQNQRKEFLQMKGNWVITSVDHSKKFKIQPFDENADAQCWVGSQWKFIPNNYSGSYTLNGGGDCPSVSQNIKFEVVGGNEFKFKKLIAGSKAKAVTQGYSTAILNQTDSQFDLQQNISFDGEVVTVVYHFQKQN